ncbi:MAG: hypothetical protein P8X98_11990 [Woeseiaceae bacterium]|jgi:predicted flap endonuclease-1-like 5' DNA nuclease/uncharacterized coiled-coil DUF342 family protein
MPELTVTLIVLLVVAAVIGAVAAWVLRGKRAEQEKSAVSEQWQHQLDAQRREQGRLLDQNKSLMEQVNQYQAQHADAKNRAKELSLAVQEAFQRRDQLQREIKDIRGNLETVLNERDQLASSVQARSETEELLREKDARIDKLAKELASWRDRLPPLIDRFRERNEEAQHLEVELAEANARIRELENARARVAVDETRIEAVGHPEELTEGMDASNDPSDDVDGEETGEYPAGPPEPHMDDFDEDRGDEGRGETYEAGNDEAAAPIQEENLLANTADDEETGEYPAGPPEPQMDDFDADDDDDFVDPPLREDRDDLQMIKGVGPAIEKTLNELGIFRFRQIADMSEYDIDRVARRLKGFHSRIHREDWIGQARALIDEAAHA